MVAIAAEDGGGERWHGWSTLWFERNCRFVRVNATRLAPPVSTGPKSIEIPYASFSCIGTSTLAIAAE